MNLTIQKDRLSGSYMYVKYQKRITLTGTCSDGTLTLQKSDASGKPAGSFRGSFTSPQIVEGTWSTPDGKKCLPFRVQAISPTDRVIRKYLMGHYLGKKSRSGAELNVLLRDDGRLRIQGEALRVMNTDTGSVHIGDVDGTAKLERDMAHFLESLDDPDSCRFTIRFTNRTIAVTEDNMNCGGMGVTFDGTYERVGPPTFDESSN